MLAGIGGVHAAGAGRAGVRRGYDQHADDRHRRAVGESAGAAPARGAGRAHRVHRRCQHGDSRQHGARHHIAGLLGCLRDSAGQWLREASRVVGMTEDPFVAHRSLLFTVAYEMLGSAADAEDVLQESWLRWADVDRAQVRNPRAYLVQIVTRQALNHLRTLSRSREDYVGEWLPEPRRTRPAVGAAAEPPQTVSIGR